RTASRRQPNRPADLTATSGEMKLVEMACLTGLSCRAGKSAGRVMGEELGFGHLLRGLREDVRPSLRRRVLQAISTVVDSDPSLAPRLLGLVGDDDTDIADQRGGGGAAPASSIGCGGGVAVGAVGGNGGSAWVRLLQGAAERRRRRRVRRRRVAVGGSGGGSGGGGVALAGEEGVASATFPDGGAILFGEDDLLERITTILGYHGSGTGFGAGVVPADGGGPGERAVGGVGPLRRALRALVELLRAPRLRPFFATAAAAAEAPTGTKGFPEDGAEHTREGGAAREGRDWWKDEVALEEEGLEQKAAASARVGQGRGGSSGWVWWRGRGRRVSRERLVEEALELTFRLIMSGDVALEALKVDKKLVAALKRVAEGGGQRLQYDSK
ncbi:unnamed protein product, partial [Hapterophycus canaliculatus]